MREISLTQGYIALVDDADYEWLNQWSWHVMKKKTVNYATRNATVKRNLQRPVFMHRLILGLTDPKIQGDHRDRNGLNNQRYNLRIATSSQNMGNITSRKNSKCKYKGVCYVPYLSSINPFMAAIKKDYKRKHLGYFKTEEEAARAYDDAARFYHGEFANLNFP